MILIGEIEYTNQMMAPADKGFLFVGQHESEWGPVYTYSESPYEDSYKAGNMTMSQTPLSVTEFLQSIVDADIAISRSASIKFKDDVGIRLKGMKDWITRTPKQ